VSFTALPTPRAAGGMKSKSKEWRIIERATDMSFGSEDDSLLSLDSLRHTKLTSALRREVGKRLPRQVLKNIATLGGLLQELARIPEEDGSSPSSSSSNSGTTRHFDEATKEYAAWGMMWNSRCTWIIKCSKPLPEPLFRAAIARLVERHAALRAEMRDPFRFFTAIQQAMSALDMWKNQGPRPRGVLAPAQRLIGRFVRWSLRNTWPRISVSRQGCDSTQGSGCLIKVLERSPTLQDAEYKLWGEAREFQPPFRALLAPYGAEAEEGALLHLTVTHMLSDGYSIVPLLDDLVNLVAKEATVLGLSDAPPPPPLPRVPNMFEAMERRIFRTIEGTDDAEGICPRITPHALTGKNTRNAHTTFATLPVEVVTSIRRGAVRVGVSDDIAMLALLGVTLAWFVNRPTEQIAMIVPQRDGPGENDMVGLFSDVRHLCICTEGLSFAGVALRLHHIVKERLWTVPELRTQFELISLNFEWTDFQEKQGFSQYVNCGERAESSFHPLRIAVDQPDKDVWRMRVSFQEGAFDEQQREQFFQLFEKSLSMLRESPLELVWPTDCPKGNASAPPA